MTGLVSLQLRSPHLLDPRYRVHSQALERRLQTLVVSGRCLVHSLLLPPHATLAARPDGRGHLHQLFTIHVGRKGERWAQVFLLDNPGSPSGIIRHR